MATKYTLREEFEEWLGKQGKKNSANQYANKGNKFVGSDVQYYELVAWFFFNDEPIYAFSLLERWKEEKKSDKSIGTYLDAYKEFLLSRDKNSISIPKPDIVIEEVRKSFKKPDLYQLDGMEGLISKLGVDDLVRLAIETSLFFQKDIVKDRFDQMCSKINITEPLPARQSTQAEQNRNKKDGKQIEPNKPHPRGLYPDKWIYQDDIDNPTFIYPIKRDENGNAPVCTVINKFTGYNLNVNLENKPFKNFIISHIWGRAIDPRYFTSLWNIVLVPAWVNHLLDKNNTEDGSLSSRLKATFMSICIKYYKLSSLDWTKWIMECPTACDKPYKNKYTLQIIHKSVDYNPDKENSYPSTVGKIGDDFIEIR